MEAFGPLAIMVLLIMLTVAVLLPMWVVWKVAQAKGQSQSYAFWGLLGWFGAVIGVVLVFRQARATQRRVDSDIAGPP